MSYSNEVEYGEIDDNGEQFHEQQHQQHDNYNNHAQHDSNTQPQSSNDSSVNQSQSHSNKPYTQATDSIDSVRLYLGNLDLAVKENDIVNLLQPYNLQIISCTFKSNYLSPETQYCFIHISDTSDNQTQTKQAIQSINDNIIPNLGQQKLKFEIQKPPITCNACGKLGHKASDCRGGMMYGGGRGGYGRGGYGGRGGGGYYGGGGGGYGPPPDRYHPYGAPRGGT